MISSHPSLQPLVDNDGILTMSLCIIHPYLQPAPPHLLAHKTLCFNAHTSTSFMIFVDWRCFVFMHISMVLLPLYPPQPIIMTVLLLLLS
jgi:hypothetical protein